MKNNWETNIKKTHRVVFTKMIDTLSQKPQIAIVLGSGLGALADLINHPVSLSYDHIPHFPVSTVTGHAGALVAGTLNGKTVVCMKGRFHNYEGYTLNEVTYPIRLFKLIGIKTLILTNAAGGINRDYKPGDLMIIKDHINFTGNNPLLGPNSKEYGPRFPDMSEAYSKRMICLAKDVATSLNIKLREGIYAAASGPSYETPAEINMLRIMGADAVGMSTVPEVIVANHMGLETFAISCITNMAAGVTEQKLSHEEVTETANRVRDNFVKLISHIIGKI